ncbi:polysaccharide deacetylase family protein [Paenibacillus alba]|uniref:polysaccharide deacetylase family protein n=1 Tax=Paenibacillus alba TaxID=1197127 RepID=UPI001FE8C415|nr:polysaccharide deacetylase family protein [Paenibacillus alba]
MTTSNWRLTLIIGGMLIATVSIWFLASQSFRPTQITADSREAPLIQGPIPEFKEQHLPVLPIEVPNDEVTKQQELPNLMTPLAAEAIATFTPTATPIATVKDSVYKTASITAQISIPVLNYHSVTVQPGNTAAITPAKLEEQMQYLADQGYKTLTLKEFIDIWEGGEKPTAKVILLTFDDGYKDNYTAALPILAKHNFRATLFVSPGMVEDGYFLNWDEIKEMHKGGWDIQPHGMTHPNLTKLNSEKQTFEITEARRQIEEELGITADVYCYPFGERNQTTLHILKEHGFRYAFTIEQGMAKPDQNPLLIRRLFVNGEAGLSSFKSLLK